MEILDLPNEVLCEIFSYLSEKYILSVVVDVCTRWRSIIELNVLFWKKLRVVIDCDNFINASFLNPSSEWFELKGKEEICIGEHDLKKVSMVQYIRFENGIKAVTRADLLLIRIIDIISKTCENFVQVEYSHCIGAGSSHTLKFFNDKYENVNEIKFDVSCCWNIAYEELTKYKNLTTIISHDYRFKRSDLYCLVDGCSQLSSIWILFARYIRNDDVIYLLEKKKNMLKELGMGLIVSDDVLNKIKECFCLNVLFFSDARFITNVGISSLTNLSRLQYLSLHRLKLQPEDLISWLSSSSLSQHLLVLDLTDYGFKTKLCWSYLQPDSWINKLYKMCLIIFGNDVNQAINQYYKPYKPETHWMYSSLK